MPCPDTWDAAAHLLPGELSADQYQQEVMPAGCHAGLEPGKANKVGNKSHESSQSENYFASNWALKSSSSFSGDVGT